MKTKIYTLTFFIVLLSGSVFGQFNLLFLGNETQVYDSLLSTFLEDAGYNVTYVSTADFKAAPYDTPDGYTGYDVLYVSEGIGSSDANNFRVSGFPIPCVSTEGWVVRDERWNFIPENTEVYFLQISNEAATEDIKTLVVTDNEHCITSEFEVDDEIVWTEEVEVVGGVSGFNLESVVDAVPLASFKDPFFVDLPSLWAIPEGATLIDGSSAGTTIESNLVILGTIAKGMSVPSEAFNNLILRSIQWVTDMCEEEGPNSIDIAKQYNLTVGPNPTQGLINISLTLPQGGNVTMHIYNLAGELVSSDVYQNRSAGKNTLQLDLSGTVNAQYIYEIVAGNDVIRGLINKN